MNKVFLYLYPIEEYNRMFLFNDESLYNRINREKPFDVLNIAINKRYREKGYRVVYAMYPDKDIFGIVPSIGDKVIYTDISFKESSGYNEDGSEKKREYLQYPSEEYLINQLGSVDEIVIGGFHFNDCVKCIAQYCYNRGIRTLVDIDLTDIFYSLYYKKDYFSLEEYSPIRYKEYFKDVFINEGEREEVIETQFKSMYGDPVFGMYDDNIKHKR